MNEAKKRVEAIRMMRRRAWDCIEGKDVDPQRMATDVIALLGERTELKVIVRGQRAMLLECERILNAVSEEYAALKGRLGEVV